MTKTPPASEGPTTNWIEVIVGVGANTDVDEIAALLVQELPAAAAGTEVRSDEVVFWIDIADSEQVLAATKAQVAVWQAAGADIDPARVRLAVAIPETEWRDAWKRYFKVSHLTRQFVVVPSWETYTPTDGELVIDLDPGMAFGTGSHASTQLVLEELQRHADTGATPNKVLDVGSGSGILAIAAAKRWPEATCLAIDNDPIAVKACGENAAINRVGDRVTSAITPLDDLAGDYPLVLANIQAHVLRALLPSLIGRTAPGGTLILSGILSPQAEPLADEFVAAGMVCDQLRTGQDPAWTSVTLIKPAGA
jgi:ribosomal protein L11 methyltransferase